MSTTIQKLRQKWQPTELMEWAKSSHRGVKFNLARSGVPAITELSQLPGGPIVPDLWGQNYWGHDGLRTTLADWYGAQPEQVLIAQGASQCGFLIAGAALAQGGEAIVETPVYQPILRAVEVWADRLTRLPRRRNDRYQPDPDELRRVITDEVRLIVLTNLHNPSHVRLEEDRLRAILALSAEVGAVVMLDEVFLPMVERDHRKHGFAHGAVSVSSLGKSWGLDALRVGWAIGPKELIHSAYRLNNLLGVNQPYLTEDLACRIMNNRVAVDFMVSRANHASSGRELLSQFMENTPEVAYVLPDGAISALIELPAGFDDLAFNERLVRETSTTVFPGSFFECPGSIRVSFGGEREEVSQGLKNLSNLIRALA